jgi:hypothetical protein
VAGSRHRPVKVARKLWEETRIDEGRIEPDGKPQPAGADRTSQAHA